MLPRIAVRIGIRRGETPRDAQRAPHCHRATVEAKRLVAIYGPNSVQNIRAERRQRHVPPDLPHGIMMTLYCVLRRRLADTIEGTHRFTSTNTKCLVSSASGAAIRGALSGNSRTGLHVVVPRHLSMPDRHKGQPSVGPHVGPFRSHAVRNLVESPLVSFHSPHPDALLSALTAKSQLGAAGVSHTWDL